MAKTRIEASGKAIIKPANSGFLAASQAEKEIIKAVRNILKKASNIFKILILLSKKKLKNQIIYFKFLNKFT